MRSPARFQRLVGRAVTFFLALTLASCRDAAAPDDLPTAEARWHARRPTAYHATVTPSCFCGLPGGVVVTVRGSVVTRVVVATGAPLAPDLAPAYPTIDQLFSTIAAAKATHYARVDVTYDAQYGFPRSVFLDRQAGVADDEISYSVQNFAVE